MFPHLRIKYTWASPEEKTRNQINCIMTNKSIHFEL